MRLTGVDLNLLVSFEALMTERSVTRAAERMSVGQPAMSASLARLRTFFDDPLLIREGRGLVATPVADSLVAPVREALTLIEQTLTVRSRFDPETDHRTFSIMASDYVILVFVGPLLAQLAREAPNVRLQVYPVDANVHDHLRRDRTDLVIMPSDLLDHRRGYPCSTLFSDRYVCAVDNGNTDIGTTITRKQFSAQPYLAYSAGSLESLAERQLDAAGITRNLQITVQSLVVAPYLLRGTGLITLIPERLAHAAGDQVDLRLIEPPMPLNPITEIMSWTPRHDNDAAHLWLRERLRELAGGPAFASTQA